MDSRSSPLRPEIIVATEHETDPLIGRVLDGRYAIVKKIARGGMATVYLATDHRLTRTVAVKVMHESLGGDAEFVARFDQEARAAAGLTHPNVVSVFDQGMDRGRPYIVMEYVQGRTLRQIIHREAPLAPQRALDLLIPIVGAVAAAHEMGIIHRDLKPENVLISTRNQPKVADFGLARAVSAHSATSAGTVIGTVSYLAPELVTNGKGGTRSDVYALGVILYEMLTGKKPHTGETPIQVAYSHVHNDLAPPATVLPPGTIPDYLDALVLTTANRSLEVRPIDAGVLLDHLLMVREALAVGKKSDPVLAERMHTITSDPAGQLTQQVPLLDERLQHTATIPITADQPTTDPMSYTPLDSAQPLIARQKKRRRHGLTIFIILLVLSVLLGFTGWYVFSGRFVDTPNFINLTQIKAEALAQKTGVNIFFENAYSENVPAGQVIDTAPKAKVPIERGGLVTAFLSQGPERYEVPTLVGQSLADATTALTEVHLTVGTITKDWDDKADLDTVIKASQKAGKSVKPGTAVDLVISKGPAPVPITSYVDKKFSAAKKFYEKAGLKVVVAEEINDAKIAEGNVISQDPPDGELNRGDTITFVVSKGPVMVEVPKVRGKGVSAAEEMLQAKGFKTKVSYAIANPLGIVISTSPKAGSEAPEGSTITINAV